MTRRLFTLIPLNPLPPLAGEEGGGGRPYARSEQYNARACQTGKRVLAAMRPGWRLMAFDSVFHLPAWRLRSRVMDSEARLRGLDRAIPDYCSKTISCARRPRR
jgi:hypothetical protein